MYKHTFGFAAFFALVATATSASAYDTPYTNNCDAISGVCITGTNASATAGLGVQGEGTFIGVAGIGDSGGVGVEGTSTGDGVIGSTTDGDGVFGTATGTGNGVKATSNTGPALWAYSTHGYSVYAQTDSNGKDAVYGSAASSWNGGEFRNTGSGDGVYASSSSGYGVEAYGDTALYGWSTGGAQTGVFGHGTTYGVYGDGSGDVSTGVWGYATGDFSNGVIGNVDCSGDTCSAVYGEVGDCASGAFCFGVYSYGNLHIEGNGEYTGSFMHVSDQRLKRDIVPLKGSLDLLLALKGVSFYWKDPSKHGGNAGIQRGFIAQDYEKVFPEWVKTDNEGHKMIDTTGLDSLEVESIRQLKAENDDLKGRLDRLEASRKVVVAGNAWGFAIGGLALGCGLIVTQRKKKGEKDEKDEKKKAE